MKKLFLFIIVFISLLGLAGCGSQKATTKNVENYDNANFKCMCRHEPDGFGFIAIYYVDEDTNLIYVYYSNNYEYTGTGFTIYYNKDGKPMTKSEFERTHMKDYHKDN